MSNDTPVSRDLDLPPVDHRGRGVLPCRRYGDLLFLSGHCPALRGKAGSQLGTDEARRAGREAALSMLATLRDEIGNLDRIQCFVKGLGLVNSDGEFSDMPAAMGGVDAFIRGVAMDYCKFGIRANCVTPGRIASPSGDGPLRCVPADGTRTQSLPRYGAVEEAAQAVLFLAGGMSEFITAESLPVDGGALNIAHNQVWGKDG